MSYLMKETRLN